MQLSPLEVAQAMGVGVAQVDRWIATDGLPSHLLASGKHRIHPAELLEWASARRLPVNAELFGAASPDLGGACLCRAMAVGGIHDHFSGCTRDELFERIVPRLPLPGEADRQLVLQLLQAREEQGATAIGGGIAIPHPRYPIVLRGHEPAVSLFLLDEPIDMGARDGQGITTIFVVLTSTVRQHLALLSQLGVALADERFRGVLARRASADVILGELERLQAPAGTAQLAAASSTTAPSTKRGAAPGEFSGRPAPPAVESPAPAPLSAAARLSGAARS